MQMRTEYMIHPVRVQYVHRLKRRGQYEGLMRLRESQGAMNKGKKHIIQMSLF